jgi:hypothetical protein
MLKHIVLVKARAGSGDQVEGIFRELAGLIGVIPGLRDFSGGPNNSPEGRSQGFTHGFVMSFDDGASRDGYVPHQEHRRVASKLGPLVDDVLVFDYGG